MSKQCNLICSSHVTWWCDFEPVGFDSWFLPEHSELLDSYHDVHIMISLSELGVVEEMSTFVFQRNLLTWANDGWRHAIFIYYLLFIIDWLVWPIGGSFCVSSVTLSFSISFICLFFLNSRYKLCTCCLIYTLDLTKKLKPFIKQQSQRLQLHENILIPSWLCFVHICKIF